MRPTYDSPKWLTQKARLIALRGHLCQDCGIESQSDFLEVHHTFYEPNRPYDDYPDDSLKLLCHECHYHITQALISLNSTFGRFTGNQITCIACAIAEAIAETGDPQLVSNWILLCLADVRKSSLLVRDGVPIA